MRKMNKPEPLPGKLSAGRAITSHPRKGLGLSQGLASLAAPTRALCWAGGLALFLTRTLTLASVCPPGYISPSSSPGEGSVLLSDLTQTPNDDVIFAAL